MADRDSGAPHLLVLAPNWLGDAVMASPLLSLLHGARDSRGRRPRLTLAVRRRWLPLFSADPRCDHLLAVERTGRHGGPLGALRLGRDLAVVAAGAVVLCPPSLRSALAARLAGIPVRVGYRSDGRGPLLTHGLARPTRGAVHHADELRRLGETVLAACGLTSAASGDEDGPDLLPGCASLPRITGGAGPEHWVFAPGTTYGEAKTWPSERAAEFVDRAVGERGVRVVLLGDANGRDFVAAMRKLSQAPWRSELPGGAAIVDLVGTTDLGAAVGVLKAARVFVGNDSGLMHVAAALGLVTVGIFGSSNPDWTSPRGRLTGTVVADGFECRPCYRRRCNQAEFCLDQVTADAVLAKVTELDGASAVRQEES